MLFKFLNNKLPNIREIISSLSSVFFILFILIALSSVIVKAETKSKTPVVTVAQAKQNSAIEELQQKIDEKNSLISDLEEEIKLYQSKVEKTQKESKNLSGTISTLDLSLKKLQKDISLTKEKVSKVGYEIDSLKKQIADSEENIDYDKQILASSIAKIYDYQSNSALEVFLDGRSLSNSWDDIDRMNLVQEGLMEKMDEIRDKKVALENIKKQNENKRADLNSLNKMLAGQSDSVVETKKETSKLLTDTKQKESNYQKILEEKKRLKDAFEEEISAYESAIKIVIDPKSLPDIGLGVLKWPLDKVVITQYFGNTPFATKNPQIYNGKGHTGVDMGTIIGTPVKASRSGVVAGTGNTDAFAGCYSYGKWVFINHDNGLSTLYAHLSSINVTIGQKVTTSEIVGLSGNTGYSTGPHLHFGTYATAGVKITTFSNSKYCKNAVIPIADPTAYLNPLSYLQN